MKVLINKEIINTDKKYYVNWLSNYTQMTTKNTYFQM